jgi:hypothetical protein
MVTNLIPLYAIGVFLGFTISQTGMTRRFWRAGQLKPGEFTYGLETKIFYDPYWFTKLLVSGIGASVTFTVMIVFIITKFTSGAWFIVMLIPSLVWVFFHIHRHYKETAAKLKLDHVPTFAYQPVIFDPAIHKELAIYFCDSWSKLGEMVMEAILRRGLPAQIIHINVNDKRAATFKQHSQEIAEHNHWEEGIIQMVESPFRDLHASVSEVLGSLRKRYPETYFEVYIGALRVNFPYGWLHMSTDRFLRDAMIEVDNVALNVKQINLDSLPLPAGFKVTFEHATDYHHEETEGQPQ